MYLCLLISSLILFHTFTPSSVRAATGEVNQLFPAEEFTHRFKSSSILMHRLGPKELFIVQIGVLRRGGSGELVCFEGESGKLSFRTIDSRGLVKSIGRADAGETFRKLIKNLIRSSPTAPMDADEATAQSVAMDGELWLFEYIDPLGNRQSLVTMPDLPEHLSTRKHDAMKDAFGNVLKSIQAMK